MCLCKSPLRPPQILDLDDACTALIDLTVSACGDQYLVPPPPHLPPPDTHGLVQVTTRTCAKTETMTITAMPCSISCIRLHRELPQASVRFRPFSSAYRKYKACSSLNACAGSQAPWCRRRAPRARKPAASAAASAPESFETDARLPVTVLFAE